MKVDDIKLTPEEQEIEDTIEKWVPASEETREHLRRIAERSKKNEAISIRIKEADAL
jgi:hypothetical protein